MELLDEWEGGSYGIEIVNNKSRWARGGVQEYGYPSRGGEKRGKREDNRGATKAHKSMKPQRGRHYNNDNEDSLP